MKPLQIGVIGSAAELRSLSDDALKIAEQLGTQIAKKGNILVFGAEKDCDSLSSAAARYAKKAGGITVAITYGKGQDIWDTDLPTVIVPVGIERGGGREFSFILSCDAVIAIAGGGGTLCEMSIAYMAYIPIVALKGHGGWADKMADNYLDTRERIKIVGATTPEEAVDIAMKLGTEKREKEKTAYRV